MRQLLSAAALVILSQLPVSQAWADETPTSKLSLESYQALDEAGRTLYVAGLADALDAAAAMTHNQRLTIIAACTHGFAADTLRETVERGDPNMMIKWAADTPAANWFIQTMILVCQLQLPPE